MPFRASISTFCCASILVKDCCRVSDNMASDMADEKTAAQYLRLRGLPFSVKEPEVRAFFDGLDVDDVQLIQTPDGRASGEAFVGFATVPGADGGLGRDKNKIGTRYIEVFRVTEPEFARIRNRSQASAFYGGGAGKRGVMGDTTVVRIRGLPFSCKREDLIGFFSGLNVDEVVFGKEPGEGGRPTGEGYVRFRSITDAESAMQRNGQHLGKRYLELFKADAEQFERFKRQMSSAQPLNSLPYQQNEYWNSWYQQEDVYGWDSYGMPVAAPRAGPRGGGAYRGAARGGGGVGGPHRGYEASARPSPYDYHGRVYGQEPTGGPPANTGYGGGYDAYGYGGGYGGGVGAGAPAGTDPASMCKVHVRGLPFRVTCHQIMEFFSPLSCVEVKLGYLPDGRVSGDGIIEFGSPEEAQEAMRKDRQMIGSRYIEVFGPNGMRVAPGTTYKRIGGVGGRGGTLGASRPMDAMPGGYQW